MKKIILKKAKKHVHLIKYFFIGSSAAILDLTIYSILFNLFDFYATVSTIISVSLSTIYGFIMNIKFNFKTSDRLHIRFTLYALVSFTGLITSAVILFILTDTLGFNGNIIKILTLPIIFILQYTLNKKFSFAGYMIEKQEKITPITKTNNPKRVAIIGAGFTGLAAAYDLAKAGHKVVLLEREKFAGGLASGFKIDKYFLEKAYHFLYQSDHHILHLAEELGIRDKINFYPSKISYFLNGNHYPFTTPMDLIKFSPLSFINRIRTGVSALYLQKTNNWKKLSKITALDWLNKWAGKEVTKIIWEPLLRGKFNIYFDKVTMSWLWGRIKIRAKSQNKDFSGEKLGYVTGGFIQFVDKLSENIKSNDGEIRTETNIKKINKLDKEIEIEYLDGQKEIYDSVLCTTPSPVFSKFIEDQKVEKEYLDKLKSVDYLGAVILIFSTKQRLSDYFWYNINDSKVPFLTLLSTSALAGTELFGGRNIYYIGAYVPNDHRYFSQENKEIIREWFDGVKRMFPDFNESKLESLDLFRFKNAQHIVDIGYEEKKLLPFKTPLDGIYLSNFSQIYPDDRGTNFAIRDGRKVAREIHKYLE